MVEKEKDIKNSKTVSRAEKTAKENEKEKDEEILYENDPLYVRGLRDEKKRDNEVFKWSDDSFAPQVKVSLDKVREERIKTENDIYEAVKRFEWKTGIKVIKLDFEAGRENFNPKVKAVLERI